MCRKRPAPRPPEHDLRPGHPDLASFPREEWSRAVKRALKAAPYEAFGYADPYYDGEFRYDRSAVGALHGVDPERVISMGTVSKSLAPGLRVGWLVVPDRLVDAVARQKGETEATSGFVDQLAMAEFIESGWYDRHIRAMRAQYRRRREQLVAAVAQASPRSRVTGMPAGLHVLVELAGGNESAVSRQSAWQRLAVEGLATFRHPDTEANRDGLVIGYVAPTPSAWSAALQALTRLLP